MRKLERLLDLSKERWIAAEVRAFHCPACEGTWGHVEEAPGALTVEPWHFPADAWVFAGGYRSYSGDTYDRAETDKGLSVGSTGRVFRAVGIEVVPAVLQDVMAKKVIARFAGFFADLKAEWALVAQSVETDVPETTDRLCSTCRRKAGRELGYHGHLRVAVVTQEEALWFPPRGRRYEAVILNHALRRRGECFLRFGLMGEGQDQTWLSNDPVHQGETIRVESPDHPPVEFEVPAEGYLVLTHPEPHHEVD